MSEAGDSELWKSRFERERAARKQAESLLHEKSRELFEINLVLSERASELDRYARRERALAELSTALARSESRATFLLLLRDRTAPLLGVRRLWLVECRSPDEVQVTRLHGASTRSDGWPAVTKAGAHGTVIARVEPGTALAMAIRRGTTVATPAFAVDDHADWKALRDHTGAEHFAIVPIVEAAGVLGTLSVAWEDVPLANDDRLRLFEQLAAVVAAHLRALRARESLAQSNELLEQTVARRTAELRSSEERFVLLFEYAPQPMLMVDRAGVIRQANRGAASLFGYAAQDLVGREVQELVPSAARTRHEAHMRTFGDEHPAGGMRRMGGRGVEALRHDGSTFIAEIELATVEVGGSLSTLVGVTDVTEITRAQAALRGSLEEKVTLLKEIHHRVKNNLQIVSSLLFLQQDGLASESAREALQDSVFRVRSMALIHEALYGVASLDRIDLNDYTRRLCSTLQASLAPRTRLQVPHGQITIGIDTAVPVGLILNELVTNALKYGVPPPSRGHVEARVEVELSEGESHYEMRVRDNGPGLSNNPFEGGRGGLGLQLVTSLTRQLRGKISVEPGEGTTFHLRWPRQEMSPPVAP